LVFGVENYWGAWAGAVSIPVAFVAFVVELRWSLPLYEARAGAQQGRRRAGCGSRLVGWWLMCEGISKVAARLKAEAKRIGSSIAGCWVTIPAKSHYRQCRLRYR
jgi:hypothetical protein